MGIFDSLMGAGISAATGNIAGLVGAGVSLAGGLMGASDTSFAAQQSDKFSYAINQEENQANAQHQQAMVLSANRQSLENIRQAQQARSMSLAAGTNQGAQFGSGLKGGQAQITGQEIFGLQGISNNLQIGQNLFGIDQQISANKLQLQATQTDLASSEATDKAVSSFGTAISGSAKPLGNLAQQFFGS